MSRSAPQPAMRKTPRGGTVGVGVVFVSGIHLDLKIEVQFSRGGVPY